MTDPAELDSALARMHINPNDYTSIRDLQAALREKLGVLTKGQMDLTSAYFTETRISFKAQGVQVVQFERLGVPTIRYNLPGFKGLFNFRSAVAFVQSKGGE